MNKAITFKSLSKDTQKALKLLKKVRKKVIEGIGGHESLTCPIAKGYGIRAKQWPFLHQDDAAILKDAGWNQAILNSFMVWYDYSFGMINRFRMRVARENFLRKYLSQ